MAKIINLTPHCVNIVRESGTLNEDGSPKYDVFASYPSEGVARAGQQAEHVDFLDGVELVSMKFTETEGLPAPAEDTFYIVSIITANAAKAEGRTTDDLLITADPVRDGAGRIIGCLRFALV